VHLILPTIADRREEIVFPRSGRVVIREPGDLLHPERFGPDQVEEAKTTLGSYMFAGRHQQKPSPAEGGLFKIRDWVLYGDMPKGISQTILSVDAAFKGTAKSDFVVVGAIAQHQTGRDIEVEVKGKTRRRAEYEYFIPYRWRNQTGITGTERAIKQMAQQFPMAVTKLIEDKANGPAIIERLAGQISGIKPYNPGSDNKLSRASAVQPIHERGGILLPIADWAKEELKEMGRDRITVGEWWDLHPPPHTSNAEHVPVAEWVKELIDEASVFPMAAHDDQVDMFVQGINWMESKAPINPAARKPITTSVFNHWQ
jgi:predicted phage terminase large subunit-like protein